MSGLFQEIMFQLGVKQFKSSGVSPSISEGFGKIPSDLEVNDQSILFSRKERFGQGDTSLTFCSTGSCTNLTGFSLFVLVFGHSSRGPLKHLKEAWLSEDHSDSLLTRISDV